MLRHLILGTLLVMSVGCNGDSTAPRVIPETPIIAGTFDLTEIRLISIVSADSAIFPLHATEESFLELTFNNSNGARVEGRGLLIFNYWLGELVNPFCLLGNFADNSIPGSIACIEPLEFEGVYDMSQGVVILLLNDNASHTFLDFRESGISYKLQENELVFETENSSGTTLTIKYMRR